METIRVNMTPCEDIKTIHASQNDNEAREWGFELHNNGDKIDSSSISDQLVFKAYEGGTEEILPTNGSTPTTSPIIADIKYPQGLLTDQEFTYRQSPTEEDGLAKITDIKGNTLVWNQLVQNGNFADTSVWQNYNSTFTVSGNTATVKTTNASNQFGIYQAITFKANHKYFISFEAKKHGTITLKRNRLSSGQEQVQEGLYRTIETASSDYSTTSPIRIIFSEPVSDITNDYFMVKNYMIVDLTQMGLDATASEFTSLFPLPYYAYNQGTLLSFNGNGIKTVGKNLLPDSEYVTNTSGATSKVISIANIPVGNAILSCYCDGILQDYTTTQLQFRKGSTTLYSRSSGSTSFSLANAGDYDNILLYTTGALAGKTVQWQLEYGSIATSYEPYTSSTLSLPISTYFPSGMDGVPYSSSNPTIVYDELTDTKAIKRTNKVIYDGSNDENWQLQSINSYNIANFTVIIDDYVPSTMNSSKCNIFTSQVSAIAQTQTEGYFLTFDKRLYIRISSSKASTVEQFRTWLASNNIEFVYRLATPTETTFTTASLVTENAEIPLSNEDGTLIGKCTEQLSSESGFFDAKIKLADEDGECYSNKIQLHVEKKP